MNKRTLAAVVGSILILLVSPAYAEAPIGLLVDGKIIAMDVAPVNINGRVMVPARYVAEALGAKVEWDPATQSVKITSKEAQASAQAALQFVPHDWISLRDLADAGVKVTSGPDSLTRLSTGSVTITIGALPEEGEPMWVTVAGGPIDQIEIRTVSSRTYIRRSDARTLGFVP